MYNTKPLYHLLTITIYLFNTFAAPGTCVAAHETSGRANVTHALYGIQDTRPRTNHAFATAAFVLAAAFVPRRNVFCDFANHNVG